MKLSSRIKIFLLLTCLTAIAPVYQVRALGGLDTTAGSAGYTQNNVIAIGSNALRTVLSFVGVLFLIMMIVGGFLWMTAAGNEARVQTAQKLIVAGVIGFIIVVSAYAITAWLGTSVVP
jgi:hypothetical protein